MKIPTVLLAALQLASHVGAQTSVTLTNTVVVCPASYSTCSTSSSSNLPASSTSILTTSSSSITATTASSGTVTVDQAGNAQFTAINQAISYAQTFAQPTVVVKAGIYNEAVTVVGNTQVTIIGESSAANDYSQNKVTISNSSTPMTIGSNSVLGITWRNINFINTATGTAAAVSLRGTKNAFYSCQFISSGTAAITSTLGIGLIANSYIEGTDKLFYGYLGMYVYGSTIAATASSSTIIYSHGYSTPVQYSQTVLDSCNIIQKSGTTNTYVYLAGPNGDGSQAIFKSTSMASLIAPGGTRAVGTNGFYGEFNTSGPGSYAYDSKRVDTLMTSSMLSNWTIDYVFAHSFTGYTQSSTSWVDSSVLSAIYAANAIATSSSTPSSSQSSTGTSSTITSSVSTSSQGTTSLVSSNSTVTSSATATSSASASPTCSLPASVPSTAFVVGPSGSCASYTNLTAAIAALPVDSTTQYIYVLAGTYTEQIPAFSRSGATIFRGESTSSLSQSSNIVTLQYSGSVLSSAGGSEAYSVFRSTNYNAKKYAFYNINFVNIAAVTPNYIAIAMDIKAQQVGFYSCGFKSGQGTFLANYGTFYLSGCRIEGSQDFVWGYGAAFISNSIIASNTPGYSIAAQSYVSTYPSQFVFDQCAFVPTTTTSMSQSTYLGRDYSVSARVAIINSFLDGHINPAGWTIKSSTNVTFAEFNNSGPGYVPTSRVSQAQILTDNSAYSAANVLGDVSWIDSSAVVPFSGFPDSLFSATSSTATSTATSTSATASPTTTGLPASSIYVVSLTPNSTEYGSVESAISALPNDGAEKLIIIMPGTYNEQININRTGKVTLRGMTNYTNDFSGNQVTISFNYGVSTSAGQDELTPVINSKKTDGSGLALYNINFVNTFAQTKNYAALAADFYGMNMAAYGCSFIGFQDTLLANQGTQLFSNCYIEGSVDFIWGFSKAYFHQCYIATNTAGASISAQSRSSATASGGYVFDACAITYTSTYGSSFGLSYLGRPYSNYSVAVYKNSYIDKNINQAGWSVWQTSNPQTSNVLFGEYNNVGPSAWTATTARASFATNLTATQVAAYDLGTFLGSTSWIDTDAYNLVPSFTFSASGLNSTTTSTLPTSTPSASANATASHPTSGTTPPSGAVLVSVNSAIANSFANLTAALASLPKDTTSQTIFIYPGSYTEQVSVSRDGPVKIIGYQSGSVGKTYTGNQVTVTYSRGLSVVAPIPAGHTDAETAVISTATSTISFYNIDFINTDNLDGSTASYVTLAASVYGDQIGFYGCSFIGWQDTLLTGNPSGYAYYESSYIEGAIDFIWGYSLSYFKGCTIGAKKSKSCITAQSRASSTAIGGYVFDQCLFTAAPDATVDLTDLVYIGRPYSAYAKVIVKYSYLDSIIQPAGWKVWSATDPRTDYVTFAEYQNTGPGNWENNTAARLAFGNATLLTSDTYTLSNVMASTSWIDMTYWNSITTPQPAVTATPSAGNSTSPPAGACIVSKTVITGQTTYSTIAGCINALPSTATVATIFIYPGTYNEQLTFNRSGATVFQGYASSPRNYSSNQVIITNSYGVNTQSDESNSDSATLYSRGKNVKFYNINFFNTFGTAQDYASLAFAIGNNGNASFYGCQLKGNQDTFDVNAGASIFAYNSYIEGSVDFIWGSGSIYFLASTIAPNEGGDSIAADKRAANTSLGGIVFDQCTVTPAPGSSVAAGSVFLGRPWNANARVAYIKTYLDSCISAAGWSQWSTSSPETDGVFFGEYQNAGPGAVSTSRASFSHQMTDLEAIAFEIANFFPSTTWIDFTALAISPFVVSSTPQTVTITSTILPTGSVPVVTQTSTALSLFTTSIPLSIITKNETDKASSTIFTTESDVYQSDVVTFTTTSFSTIIPAPKTTTVTIDDVVSSTLTLRGASSTEVLLKTSKITRTTIITPSPITVYQTVVVSDIAVSTVPPKTVSQVITAISSSITTSTSTPKGKTEVLKSTSTILESFTAVTPSVKITQTSLVLSTSLKISTPKGVTQTSIFYTTIAAPAPTTVAAKKGVTLYISSTSVVFKTSKTTITATCTPAAKVKRYYFIDESLDERDIVRRDTSSSSSSSIPTITVYTTLPQSTSTSVFLLSTASTTTIYASKSTSTATFTSYIYKTSTIPGSTFATTISSTKIVEKSTALPVSTSTILVDLEGTSIATVSLKGVTSTSTSIIYSTAKTSTSTAPGITVQALTSSTLVSTQYTALPTQTILSTVTSLKLATSIIILPTPTVTSTSLLLITSKTTSTPPAITEIVTLIETSVIKSTTTLPVVTSLVLKTSSVSETEATITSTGTTIKTTVVKSTSTIWSTVTKTSKGAGVCTA
ncbi:related to pectinesterase [Phialocephala subalpina]|uniref:pectinesterase n=1 Tax=Phialocephala subalpina TaxID=576137 RepID=A0A1L7X298_9HELO|nr:related to pectinesterase [Phialocephala subalpina]